MSSVPFVDLQAQYRRIKAEVDARIQAVLDHGRFIMGPEVVELEDALADFAGCKHVVSASSGTDALLMALMAEGVGPGHAVFVPAFTFTASAEVILMTGATPVFVDIDSRTFGIDATHLGEKMDAVASGGVLEPRAVIAVDLFGLPADYSRIHSLAAPRGVFILADAAQSFGARLGEDRVGTLAPVTATSFYPSKPLGCYGDGGAVFTDDADRADTLRSIRAHGKGGAEHDIERTGLNGRLDTLQAAILLAKLGVFSDELAAREQLARHYDSRLDELVATPFRPEGRTSAWAQYSILLEERDRVATALKEEGIPTAVYYPMPMHLQSAYTDYGDGEGSLPVSERLSSQILSLPMHPYMDDATLERICAIFERVLS
jgi:UDP-2-acetamido-2-deoxy-ribo-hexuluronate aminotransferase